MNTVERIEDKLKEAFTPTQLELIDDSARHAGHAEAKKSGGGHFNLKIVSAKFEGLSQVERHRAIYAALAEEMQAAIHALSIQALTPGEAA